MVPRKTWTESSGTFLDAPPARCYNAAEAEVIEAVGLTKRYGNTRERPPAVDDLHLSLRPGELFGFLGENGAGKTTTIKMLTGLIPPTSGVARIGGHDVRREPLAAKRLVGYVPDNPFLYDRLTGREFLRFLADLYGVPAGPAREARMEDLLALFELDPKANAPIGGYSRGMRQKIALAGALLHDPRALFLDEPTVGLDPRSARLIKDILSQLRDRGAAVFFSTHILEIAERMCDRVIIINNGEIIASGTVDELRRMQGAGSLEDIFLKLTGGAEYAEIAEVLA
jgi:ABC-2 type transport system ATP-binding protein